MTPALRFGLGWFLLGMAVMFVIAVPVVIGL